MTKTELNNEYFEWMYQRACGGKFSRGASYRKLLRYLHGTPFSYTVKMDGNRAEDGIELRYRFGYERGLVGCMIASYLDDRPCSVLEMLVALAVRCEEHIMDDPSVGDRTGQWFWNMIVNLGLNSMSDARFDRDQAERIVLRFLKREYGRDGRGGLFTTSRNDRDLRRTEIWYQMCWYLEDIL